MNYPCEFLKQPGSGIMSIFLLSKASNMVRKVRVKVP